MQSPQSLATHLPWSNPSTAVFCGQAAERCSSAPTCACHACIPCYRHALPIIVLAKAQHTKEKPANGPMSVRKICSRPGLQQHVSMIAARRNRARSRPAGFQSEALYVCFAMTFVVDNLIASRQVEQKLRGDSAI